CFVDSFWASVFVGRTVATVAELSFMTQLVLTARSMSEGWVRKLATLPIFLVAVAECFSWHAVLTTNYLGNFVEESLWMTSVVITLAVMSSKASGRLKRTLTGMMVGALGYVTFMGTVDVRMYFTRLRADSAAGRTYLSISEGLHDLISRRVVTFAWSDWHEEM